MRFKLATACTGSSHDSRNDPGRSGLARKGNYVLSGRTLARACARPRAACRPRGTSFRGANDAHVLGRRGSGRCITWTSTSMSHSFDAPRGGDHGVGSGVFTRPEPDGTAGDGRGSDGAAAVGTGSVGDAVGVGAGGLGAVLWAG